VIAPVSIAARKDDRSPSRARKQAVLENRLLSRARKQAVLESVFSAQPAKNEETAPWTIR
jgi:hypothetical protein